jgi:hypothetical protein
MPGTTTPAEHPTTITHPATAHPTTAHPTTTLVWIDREGAVLARWDGQATTQRIKAGIPPRHRATGHIHRDPLVRHGGGGPVEDRLERARAERERAFLAKVEAAIPTEDELVIIGPGVIHEHLAHLMVGHDRQHRRTRSVRAEPADHLTQHQIVARLRAIVGAEPPRGRRPMRSSPGAGAQRARHPDRRTRAVDAAELAPSVDDWDED